ncbi:MAG: hypothetical protein L6Q83_07220, partial [Gammaproteobacteria bacterium]|nr:hypothetical protein [Gammaproteobacteria bacterium]
MTGRIMTAPRRTGGARSLHRTHASVNWPYAVSRDEDGATVCTARPFLPKGEPFGPGNCGAANNVNGVHETGGFFAFCSGVIVRLELIEEVSTMRTAFLVILTLAFNTPLI